MMDLDTMELRRKRPSMEEQRAQVAQFARMWQPHDWTTMLQSQSQPAPPQEPTGSQA